MQYKDHWNYEYDDPLTFDLYPLNYLCPDANHPHMIDLGLPSGTKWACCDVGANNPGEQGSLYAWGETKTKEDYLPTNYQYYHGTDVDGDGQYWAYRGTKTLYHVYYWGYPEWGWGLNDDYDHFNTAQECQHFIDTLDDFDVEGYEIEECKKYFLPEPWYSTIPQYSSSIDAATANWGDGWSMPSEEQAMELIEQCEILDLYDGNDQQYQLAIGPNNKCIILKNGSYWTTNWDNENYSQNMSQIICYKYSFSQHHHSVDASCFDVYSCGLFDCTNGLFVRAVRKQ